MESDQARISFTTMMDEEMCKQSIIVNPFDNTWDDLLVSCRQNAPELFQRVKSSKTLRDRLILLLKKRSEEIAKELTASGIEVELTDSQKAVDDLILMREESERKKGEKKAAKNAAIAATVIKDAAMRGLVKKSAPGTSQENVSKPQPQQDNQDYASSSNTGTTSLVRRKRRNPNSALIEYFKERDSTKSSLEVQREMHRDRIQLQERELEIRKLELDVRRLEAENQKAFNNQILTILLQRQNQF